MSSPASVLGWVLAAILIGVLSFVCLYQRQELEDREHRVAAALSRGLADLERKVELSGSRWQALMESMRWELQAKKEIVYVTLPDPAEPGMKEELPADSGKVSSEATEETLLLPPIPEGVSAKDVIEKDLAEILDDPRLNPGGKRPSMVEVARARVELVRAQSEIMVLDSEIRLDFNLGMERLRPEGEFVDYAPGEKYQTLEGVLTAGELIPGGGVRMYYFYPELFPELYEKVSRKAEVAETATRRLLAMLGE